MINDATIALVKEFEGLRLTAYQDSVGVWTIGYGTTAMAGVGIAPKAGMKITEADAEMYLRRGMEKFAAQIRPLITRPISGNEFGAFLSLAYNIGPGAFKKSSALRKFNAGDKAGAADAILLWNKAGGKVLNGLVRRRKAERDLFLRPDSNSAKPAPKPAQPAPELAKKPNAHKPITPGMTRNPNQPKHWLTHVLNALAAIFDLFKRK